MEENLKEVYVTYDPMEASLIQAKLDDEEIEYNVKGNSNLTMTMDTFNAQISRMALKQPIKFFVKEEDYDKAKAVIEKDNSDMLQDDLEY
jgi:hypothetical protein